MTELLSASAPPSPHINLDEAMLTDDQRIKIERLQAAGGLGGTVLRASGLDVEAAENDTGFAPVETSSNVHEESSDTDGLTPEMQEAKRTLEGMRYDLTELAWQLKGPIEQGEYDSLIGDDISGRLPTMFMYRLMQRHAQDSGTKPPNIIFAAPDKEPQLEGTRPGDEDANAQARQEKAQNLQKYFQKQESMGRLGKKSLLVTEMIATGENLSDILGNTPDSHPIDVATLAKSPFFDHERQMDLIGGAAFYVGSVDQAAYHQGKVTGRAKDGTNATTHRREDYDSESVDFAYAYTQKMADEAYDEVFKNDSEIDY